MNRVPKTHFIVGFLLFTLYFLIYFLYNNISLVLEIIMKFLKKIIRKLKPVLDYSFYDKALLSKRNYSFDSDYIIISYDCDVTNETHYKKYKKEIIEFNFFCRKKLTLMPLEYQFFKGSDGFGSPVFYKSTNNLRRAQLIYTKEDCHSSVEELFKKYQLKILSHSFSKF